MSTRKNRLHWFASLLLLVPLLAGCAPAEAATLATSAPASAPTLAPSPVAEAPTPTLAATQVPPTVAPTPAPEPTATAQPSADDATDLRPLSRTWGGYEFALAANPQDSSRTDVTVTSVASGEVVYQITLDDLYIEHYHGLEFHNGSLYVIRRTGDVSGNSDDWSDELWRYDAQQQGAQLCSLQGLDFRVAPDEQTIAVCCLGSDQLTFLGPTGETLHQFAIDELSVPSPSLPGPPGVHPDIWSADGQAFWGEAAAAATTNAFFRIDVASWQVAVYDPAGLKLGLDYALNPDRGLLAYSDYPLVFDADTAQRLKDNGQPVTLYVYDFEAGTTDTVAISTAEAFHPQWLDADTLEFDNPAGDGRTTHIMP